MPENAAFRYTSREKNGLARLAATQAAGEQCSEQRPVLFALEAAQDLVPARAPGPPHSGCQIGSEQPAFSCFMG